jgi:hypothetical protein
MAYDKMNDYIESVFTVFKMVNKKAEQQRDKKMKFIALIIFNYVVKIAKDNHFDLKNIEDKETINLIPFFEYVSYNNIEFYDFSNIEMTDVDTSKSEDLERFVLTHIYYITQTTSQKENNIISKMV